MQSKGGLTVTGRGAAVLLREVKKAFTDICKQTRKKEQVRSDIGERAF